MELRWISPWSLFPMKILTFLSLEHFLMFWFFSWLLWWRFLLQLVFTPNTTQWCVHWPSSLRAPGTGVWCGAHWPGAPHRTSTCCPPSASSLPGGWTGCERTVWVAVTGCRCPGSIPRCDPDNNQPHGLRSGLGSGRRPVEPPAERPPGKWSPASFPLSAPKKALLWAMQASQTLGLTRSQGAFGNQFFSLSLS